MVVVVGVALQVVVEEAVIHQGVFSEAALGGMRGEDFKGDFGWWIAHLSSVQIDRSLGRCDGIGVARIHRD